MSAWLTGQGRVPQVRTSQLLRVEEIIVAVKSSYLFLLSWREMIPGNFHIDIPILIIEYFI